MAYTSSTVTKGRATGIVVAIGMKTEIGAIAESLRGGDTRVRKVRRARYPRPSRNFKLTDLSTTPTGPQERRRSRSLALLRLGVGTHRLGHDWLFPRHQRRHSTSAHALLARHRPVRHRRHLCLVLLRCQRLEDEQGDHTVCYCYWIGHDPCLARRAFHSNPTAAET